MSDPADVEHQTCQHPAHEFKGQGTDRCQVDLWPNGTNDHVCHRRREHGVHKVWDAIRALPTIGPDEPWPPHQNGSFEAGEGS